jgi:predicted peptidase
MRVLLRLAGAAAWVVVWMLGSRPAQSPGLEALAAQSAVDPLTPIDGFVAKSLTTDDGTIVPYRLFIPKVTAESGALPLVIWLHGADGMGTDNIKQISGDQVPGTRIWTNARTQAEHPAFVVAPQSPSGGWGAAASATRLLAVVNSLESEFHLDERRVYLLGQSAGGRVAWNVLTQEPNIFGAVVLVCPAFPPLIATDRPPTKALAPLPIWAFIGEDDPGRNTLVELVRALRSVGGQPRFTEYAGMGHEIWTRVFQEPELVTWMFSQHR